MIACYLPLIVGCHESLARYYTVPCVILEKPGQIVILFNFLKEKIDCEYPYNFRSRSQLNFSPDVGEEDKIRK